MIMWKGCYPSACRALVTGFSVIEILITLVLIAISVSLALPSLQQFSANNQVLAASNSIVSGLNMARFNAITTGEETTICPSADGQSCSNDSWSSGWIVFADENGNSAADAAELVRIVEIEGNIQASGFGNALTFESDGTTSRDSDTVITSCYKNAGVSNRCVDVTINPFGSIASAESNYMEPEVASTGDNPVSGTTS
ncbi:MAG: GspH/FimT family pseudopilin [Xanthomonadales bacterium]|nr:GspH/FimT family pseudopilin [Xanthomonadales bacterium]